MKNYRAFFLDFDGTLVDSEGSLFEAYCRLLSSFSKEPSRKEFESYIGPSIYEISGLIKKKHKIDQELDQIYKKYLYFVEKSYDSVSLMPGVEGVFSFAKSNSIKLYVVSSAPLLIVKRVLERFNIAGRFENFFTCESVGKMKPDPSIYRYALEATKFLGGEVLCFEDSVAGVESALGAGLEVVSINNTFPEDKKLIQYSSLQEFVEQNFAKAFSEEK
ncbi:MAG: HAD family phosphatase [Bdellovibrionota bacterium]|nr:HAD family phosphatase [Bdellovibrionota bacterium]